MTHTLDTHAVSDSSTKTMRAAVVTEFGAPLHVEDHDLPTPGYGEALVKLETSGVCHTDLHAAHGDWPVKPEPPFIPGHEGYGTVVALGNGVEDLKVGDKVGNAWLWSACGSCEYCRTGWETLCESQRNGGYSVDGSFGSYMLVNAAYAARDPTTPTRSKSRPSCAPVSPSTKASRSPTPVRASGSRSRASAVWATSRCSTHGPWDYGWWPSTSTTPSSPSPLASALRSL
jgi:Alcohol dehydrogenase GroES-like domain